MNKSDIITILSKSEDFSEEKSKEIFEFILDAIRDGLINDDKVLISGFGSFEIKIRKPKKGRNPKTGEELIIPSKKVIKFKPGKLLNFII